MSNYRDGLRVWVGDLDGYISIDAINAANEQEAEEEALNHELEEIGDILLLAGKTTSAWQLNRKEITPSEWRHAVHQAEMALGSEPDAILRHGTHGQEGAEGNFLRAMLDLGRSYAVAKYARWERLDYSSAITATLPHGIRALVNQFLAAEGIERSAYTDETIRSVLGRREAGGTSAYRRTGILQTALHAIADAAPNHPGGTALNRDRTRIILSLTRLHFSALELRLSSVQGLRDLIAAYAADRDTLGSDRNRLTLNGRTISAWRLRHVRPLLDFYPYSIRHGLARAAAVGEYSRATFVNELALAHCGVLRMRRAGRDSTRSR